MYVRIARFESGDSDWDELITQIGDTVRSGGKGTPIEEPGGWTRRSNLGGDVEGGAR